MQKLPLDGQSDQFKSSPRSAPAAAFEVDVLERYFQSISLTVLTDKQIAVFDDGAAAEGE